MIAQTRVITDRQTPLEVNVSGSCGTAVVDQDGNIGAVQAVGRRLDNVGLRDGAVAVVDRAHPWQRPFDPLHHILVRQRLHVCQRQLNNQTIDRHQLATDDGPVSPNSSYRLGEQRHIRMEQHVHGDGLFPWSTFSDNRPGRRLFRQNTRLQLPASLNPPHTGQERHRAQGICVDFIVRE